MVTKLFLIVTGLLIWLQYKREKNILNLISVLMVPYFFIVLFNNFLFYRLGFYRITDEVLFMIMGSLVAFFLGSCLVSTKKMPIIYEADNDTRYIQYDISKMAIVLFFIAVIGLLKFYVLLKSGAFLAAEFEESEGKMGLGLVGHLMLLSSSISPIVFLYWLDHKKKIGYLVVIILIILLHFTTFIKYHVIGVVVSLFIFTMIYKKSLLKKGIVSLFSTVVLLFVGNYYIGFALRDASALVDFYVNHLWMYIGGSLIYDQYVFDPGVTGKVSIVYKLCSFLMALPNMFIQKLFGDNASLVPFQGQPVLPVSNSVVDEWSNVADAFGYLYPAKDTVFEQISYFVIIFLLGILFSWLYVSAKRKHKYYNTFICNFLTYFVFLNFFGTFFAKSSPWEILIYSLVIPNFFLRKTKILKGEIHFI